MIAYENLKHITPDMVVLESIGTTISPMTGLSYAVMQDGKHYDPDTETYIGEIDVDEYMGTISNDDEITFMAIQDQELNDYERYYKFEKGGELKSIMSKKDIGVVIPKTYQIGDKEFGNTYKVERVNTKKYSANDENRHYNFRIWEYDKSLDLFDEIKSPSGKLKALERIEMSEDYAKGGKITIEGNPYGDGADGELGDFFIYRDGVEVVSWNRDELEEDEDVEDLAKEMFYLWKNDKEELGKRLDRISYATGGKIMVEIVDNLDDHTDYKEGTILEVEYIDDDDYMITKEGYYLSEGEVDFADKESASNFYKEMNKRTDERGYFKKGGKTQKEYEFSYRIYDESGEEIDNGTHKMMGLDRESAYNKAVISIQEGLNDGEELEVSQLNYENRLKKGYAKGGVISTKSKDVKSIERTNKGVPPFKGVITLNSGEKLNFTDKTDPFGTKKLNRNPDGSKEMIHNNGEKTFLSKKQIDEMIKEFTDYAKGGMITEESNYDILANVKKEQGESDFYYALYDKLVAYGERPKIAFSEMKEVFYNYDENMSDYIDLPFAKGGSVDKDLPYLIYVSNTNNPNPNKQLVAKVRGKGDAILILSELQKTEAPLEYTLKDNK